MGETLDWGTQKVRAKKIEGKASLCLRFKSNQPSHAPVSRHGSHLGRKKTIKCHKYVLRSQNSGEGFLQMIPAFFFDIVGHDTKLYFHI